MQMPLLLASWFPGCSDEDALRLLKDAGVDGIELRHLGDEAARIRKAGLLVSFHLPTPNGEEPRINLCADDFCAPFKDGRMKGLALSDISFLGFHLGYSCLEARKVAGGPDLPLSPTLSEMETLSRIARTVRELRALTGREILVENLDYGPTGALEYVCEVPFIRRLCEESGCGLIWDISHAMVSAEPMGLTVVQYLSSYIKQLSPFVREIHLNRAHDGKDAHLPAGEEEHGWLRRGFEAGMRPIAVTLERHWGNESGAVFAARLAEELRELRQEITHSRLYTQLG